jgi:hypothetical protein
MCGGSVVAEKLWLSIRHMKVREKGCRLHEGDIFKLGRLKFRVREICMTP